MVKIEERLQMIDLVQPVRLGLTSSQNSYPNEENTTGQINNLRDGVMNHENKIDILREATEQIILKARDLDNTMDNFIRYGVYEFQHWKNEMYATINGLIYRTHPLEQQVNDTMEGYNFLASRIDTLEKEIQ